MLKGVLTLLSQLVGSAYVDDGRIVRAMAVILSAQAILVCAKSQTHQSTRVKEIGRRVEDCVAIARASPVEVVKQRFAI